MAATYGLKTPVDEPIEIRLERGKTSMPWVLCAARNERGTINVSLTAGGHGTPHAFSTLQSARPIPGKAVPGWQAELLHAVEGGLYKVIEVR